MFNFYIGEERDAHADTIKLFKEIGAGKYEAFTSRYMIDELENAPEAKCDKMLNLILEYDIQKKYETVPLHRFSLLPASPPSGVKNAPPC